MSEYTNWNFFYDKVYEGIDDIEFYRYDTFFNDEDEYEPTEEELEAMYAEEATI